MRLAALLIVSCASFAVVVRHDVSDSAYLVDAGDYPMLAYLPGEGEGVLISRQWVVTAAHAVLWRPVHELTLNGISRAVEKVVVHPGYKKPPRELQSGDAAPLMQFMNNSDDIALIKLKDPVDDVAPAQIYRGSGEPGRMAMIVGRGATGNGIAGEYPGSSHRERLRRAYSRISSADTRWLALRFEGPPKALPLEGMPADGDSGAPIFIRTGRVWLLSGVASHKSVSGPLSEFRCCLYGQITYQVRLSRYARWIDSILAAN